MNRSRPTHRCELRNLVHRGGWIIESGEAGHQDGQATTLVVSEQDSFLDEVLSKDVALCFEMVDPLSPLSIDLTGKNDWHQPPWRQNELHRRFVST